MPILAVSGGRTDAFARVREISRGISSASFATYLEQRHRLGVQPPVVPLLHAALVRVVNEPALLQDLGADALGLLDALHQPLDGNVRLRRGLDVILQREKERAESGENRFIGKYFLDPRKASHFPDSPAPLLTSLLTIG